MKDIVHIMVYYLASNCYAKTFFLFSILVEENIPYEKVPRIAINIESPLNERSWLGVHVWGRNINYKF